MAVVEGEMRKEEGGLFQTKAKAGTQEIRGTLHLTWNYSQLFQDNGSRLAKSFRPC